MFRRRELLRLCETERFDVDKINIDILIKKLFKGM
jgi:hypothetical protein